MIGRVVSYCSPFLFTTLWALKPRQNNDILHVLAHYSLYNAPKCNKIEGFGALSA